MTSGTSVPPITTMRPSGSTSGAPKGPVGWCSSVVGEPGTDVSSRAPSTWATSPDESGNQSTNTDRPSTRTRGMPATPARVSTMPPETPNRPGPSHASLDPSGAQSK